MSYSKKQLVRMTFPEHDFGAGAEVYSFRLPYDEHGNAQQGRLVNVGVMCITETWANDGDGSAPVGGVQIGTADDNDAYAKLVVADATADEDCYDVTDDTDAILDEDIPSGTLVEVNLVQCTDSGTAAGIGMPFVDFYVW